ncbi:MAG: Tetratricopeptide repeat [Acidobacteriota bacterium]|nr:Tetratricopeptide repeat [Acidobacteriota bacterium]
MTKTCPSCGFVSNTEARFCRMCGAMLPRASSEFGDGSVSPSASTVPLSNSRPTTDALSTHNTGSPDGARTGRIRREEMEEFLRRAGEAGEAAFADDAHEPSTANAERPLTIRVRPIESQPAQTDSQPLMTTTTESPSSSIAPSSSPAAPADVQPAPSSNVAVTAASSTVSAVVPSSSESAVTASSATVGAESATRKHSGGDAQTASRSSSRESARRPVEDRASRVRAGASVFAVIAVLVAAGVVLAWYAVHRLQRRAPAPAASTAASTANAPATEAARQSAAAKLAEADQLIAAGRESEAVARLREAAALDPANAEPHRRLARLLLSEGARRTAIEELRAVVRIAPTDANSWRDLAAAQSSEGLYADAAESYHALFGISADAARDDRTQLLYADALRLSGRTQEAQSFYKRLASSPVAEVARASRQRLAQLASANDNETKNANLNANAARGALATPTVAPSNTARDARANAEAAHTTDANKSTAAVQARPTPATLPVAASSKEHFARGVELWRTNRAAALTELGTAAQKGNADASYYLGLNLAEGRDPRALKRAQLIAALTYFQRARHGRFASEARRYEDSLGKEYDRRRAGREP